MSFTVLDNVKFTLSTGFVTSFELQFVFVGQQAAACVDGQLTTAAFRIIPEAVDFT